MSGEKIIAVNRKASHDYSLEERFEAGLVLTGTEIKSIRQGKAQFKDAYVSFISGEAWIKEMHIAAYDHGNQFNHDETRQRKLLLHKLEIVKLQQKVKLKGYTVVPVKLYLKNGRAKMEITLNIEIMGGRVVPVPLRPETGYQLEAELLEQTVSEKTKMIVLTHPNNPTTTVYNRQSLEILRDFVIRHDLILVCDQAFEDFCYENEMITPAAMDGLFERTVTVFSFSKGMGLSGLRVGYLVCGDEIMDSLYANAVSVLGATNTACQKALIAALEDPSFMQEFERAFDVRRHAAEKILNSIPNVHADLPQSGFLCWVDVSRLGDSSQIVQYLVKHAQVAVNDGKNYGPGGEGHLRIVLGVYRDDAKVIAALERIKAALIQWQEENHV